MASNAEFAYSYLRSAGLSDGAAVGVVGNLIAESGLNTRIKGDGGRATGLAQWHDPRWSSLVSWARAKGQDPYALETQLGYAVVEANTAAGGNVWAKLKSVKDPVTASALWMRLFERPADQSDAAAQRRAQAGVKALKGSSGTDWKKVVASGLDPLGIGSKVLGVGEDVVSAAADPVGAAIQGAATTVVEGAKPLMLKGAFTLLAVGLIGAGAYRAVAGRPA